MSDNFDRSSAKTQAFYTFLQSFGFLEYGAVVERSVVFEVLGITMPETATYDIYKDIILYELYMVGQVRELLLKEGKYFGKDGDTYRVLLPSENEEKIDNFMKSAEKKLKRARTLLRYTPTEGTAVDMNAVSQRNRILSKLDDISEERDTVKQSKKDKKDKKAK